MKTIQFRTATQADASAIARLVNRAYRPEEGAAGWTHEADLVAGDRVSVAQVVDAIVHPHTAILLALQGNTVVATVQVEQHGRTGHIGMFAVLPVLQGVGVGRQLLGYAEQYAVDCFGAEKWVMFVLSARHELLAFYQRCGYQATGEVMDYPLLAGAGTPKLANLQVDILEKQVG